MQDGYLCLLSDFLRFMQVLGRDDRGGLEFAVVFLSFDG
jgi:hypothetical protein